jgi:hypothetical protein
MSDVLALRRDRFGHLRRTQCIHNETASGEAKADIGSKDKENAY